MYVHYIQDHSLYVHKGLQWQKGSQIDSKTADFSVFQEAVASLA
tara:strand:- start:170 stop:301 length:132 start_codon:yes stop_codon:yes gene_type:complete